MGRGQLPDRHRNEAWWERIGRMVGFILCAPMRVVLHGSAHSPSHTRDAPTAHMHTHTQVTLVLCQSHRRHWVGDVHVA